MIRMKEYDVVAASAADADELCDIFMNHISAHNEYISHGEIQMGVGIGKMVDGRLVVSPSPDGRSFWMKYILGKIADREAAAVFKAVLATGETAGFCVVEITDDGAEPFGVVCDVLVREDCRRSGIGAALLDKGLTWLRDNGVKDIYLESGLDNIAAHEYFMRRGFVKVSEIYKLA